MTEPLPTGRPRRGPAPALLGSLAEPLYRFAITRRNRRFDSRRGVTEFDRPVVSVGNLSVGGTGKTPLTMLLIEHLRAQGRWPCVAMRGYRRHQGKSDEAAEYRRAFPDLPMVVQPNRTNGLLSLFAGEGGERVDCILLDDGFQHRQIARQCDIVLVDATRDPFADSLLPKGWLREPVESLARASAAVITHADGASQGVAAMQARIADIVGRAVPVIAASHEWDGLVVATGGGSPGGQEPLSWLAGRRVFACCAIGNPDAFLSQARSHAGVVGTMVLRDHDPFGPSTTRSLLESASRAGADCLLVTQKDWVKLRRVPVPLPVAVPMLRMALRTPGDLLDLVGRTVRSYDPPGA